MNREILHDLAGAWRRHLWLREFTLAVLAAEAAYLLFGRVALAPAFLLALGALLARSQPWRIDTRAFAAHLDRIRPEFEESSWLWLRDGSELSLFERIQLQRLERACQSAHSRPPRPATRGLIPLVLLALGLPLILAHLGFVAPFQPAAAKPSPTVAGPAAGEAPAAPVQIRSAEVLITPPAYTGRAARTVSTLDTEVEAGSTVRWTLDFDGGPSSARLLTTAGGKALDLVPAEGKAGRFRGERVVEELTVYTIATGTSERPLAGTHLLRVIPDRPPGLAIVEPAQVRTELPAAVPVRVAVRATDDHGVGDVWLVATVAKGSGESVKFREQKFALTPREADLHDATLDLAGLGLAAGDELYFHVEALDRRTPRPNLARSETRFVTIAGGQSQLSKTGRGINGVNLVPEYFRSQRQIIIDTEKLIAERAQISDKEFRDRSNDLGIDQQLLRLRYGRFLGEEAEGDLVPSAPLKTNAAGVPDALTHRHDTASDHFHPGPPTEDKKADASAPKDAKEVIAPFVHQHDSREIATYFDHQTKGTLRDVLSAMWESEGFLRQAKPAESLPAQHRALAILKYLQQGDRAYVQRVGFEAAPIKFAERRMQGDISTVARFARLPAPAAAPEEDQVVLREALRAVDFAAVRPALRESERRALQRLDGVLSRLAVTSPEAAVAGLQALREAIVPSAEPGRTLPALQEAILRLLPPTEARPRRLGEPSPALAERYQRALAGGATP